MVYTIQNTYYNIWEQDVGSSRLLRFKNACVSGIKPFSLDNIIITEIDLKNEKTHLNQKGVKVNVDI